MYERKNRREEPTAEPETQEIGFTLEPAKVEIGSGYALSVHYDEHEKPIIDIKTYGEVDLTKVQKEIERIFPNARIRQCQTNKPSVTIVKAKKRK